MYHFLLETYPGYAIIFVVTFTVTTLVLRGLLAGQRQARQAEHDARMAQMHKDHDLRMNEMRRDHYKRIDDMRRKLR